MLPAASMMAAFCTLASAGIITVNEGGGDGGGTPYDVPALTNYQTTGADMAGMQVTACLQNGSCSTATWTATGPAAGTASTMNWILSLDGDTFSAPWTLTNLNPQIPLTGLTIKGRPGQTVFDIISPSIASPGSWFGYPATYVPAVNSFPDAKAVYSNPLRINGAFSGDLYLTLAIDFGIGFLGSVSFRADTDHGTIPFVPIPEPGPRGFVMTGLIVLAITRIRWHRRA